MRDIEIELNIKAMNAGILPAFNSTEIDKLFETLDKEQTRAAKRKFRKMWRKERDRMLRTAETPAEFERISKSFESPSVRRSIVKKMIRQQ
tara:strand:+ start:643 stop:915 length:273 start_codon:yes stop_codon:yes gene_type:complete